MSLLINMEDDNIRNFIEYEKELISSVARMNLIWIDNVKPESLCLTCLGVKYRNDGSFDQIEHISAMIEQGYGKCDSIVAWFMAIYSVMGIESEPILVKRSEQELHAQLKIKEGNNIKIIDPSVNLLKLNKEFCQTCNSRSNRF